MAREQAQTTGSIFPRGFSVKNKWPWPLVRSEQVLTLNYGKALTAATRKDGAVPVYGTNGQCGWHNTSLSDGPGLILGRKGQGPLGVEWCESPFWVIDTAYYVSLKDESADLKYLYYLIKYIGLNHLKDGTSNPSLSRDTFNALLLPFPPPSDQQAIACILGALDDKIELNRRRNRTLEAMARAIFQSWFVDFDPVKAKAAGRTPHGLKPEVAALFPDAFEESALGPIPEGWRVGKVADIITISRIPLIPGDFPDEIFDHYSIPAYDACQKPAADLGASIKSQKFLVTEECVLVSKLNPKTPRVWIPDSTSDRRQIASTEFLVCRPKGTATIGRSYFYCLSRDTSFADHLTSRATGTSNSHQRVRPDDFLAYDIPIPVDRVAEAFEKCVEPLLDRVMVANFESRTLAALRDALLPKLISGELRVPDVERIIGRVA